MSPLFYKNLEHFKQTAGYIIENKWYPRVTSIMSVKAKPGLYYYYSQQKNFSSAQNSLEKAAKEGSFIHSILEEILQGNTPQIPASLRALVQAFVSFLEQNRIEPVLVEKIVKSEKHWYAGQVDLMAKLNGELGVIDIKTSSAIWPEYGLQIAAYAQALQESGFPQQVGFKNLRRWILRVDQFRPCLLCQAKMRTKGGNTKIKNNNHKTNCLHQWGPLSPEIELKELNDFDQDLKAFLACKDLWAWEHKAWLAKLRASY